MAVKQYVAVQLGVIYDSPGDQWKRGRLDVMKQPYSKALRLPLERARDRLKTCLVCCLWTGGVPGQEVVVEGVKLGKKAPMPAEIPEKGAQKMGGFPAHLGLKITENAVFHSKVLTKIYSQDFF